MSPARSSAILLSALFATSLQIGCGSVEETDGEETATATRALVGGSAAESPPPASCDQRNPGVTGIQLVVRVDTYQGVITGRNGKHEIAYGTIVRTPWVFDDSIVDTSNVQLALNVKSKKDPTGLPYEIPFSVGQEVEVGGEYIPAATSGASSDDGPAAVVHFTHAPCGYVGVDGKVYK